MSDAKIRGEIQPETNFVSRSTGNQYRRDAQGNIKRWVHRDARWIGASSTLDLANDGRFTPVVHKPLQYGKSLVDIDYASLEQRLTALYGEKTADYPTAFQQAVMNHAHHANQPHFDTQAVMHANPCNEIFLNGPIELAQINKQEDTMSTFTAAELEEKINPTPVTRSTTYMDVRELEQANEHAAAAVIEVVQVMKSRANYLNGGLGTQGVRISEKYEKRLQGILRDMRKDEEVILNETAAKLAKVKKALG